MVFNKSIKVLKRFRPTKSVLVESKTIPDESLLFECGTLSALKSSEAELIRKDYPDSQSAYAFLGVLQIRQKYSYIVLVTDCHQVGKLTNGIEIYQVTQTVLVSLHDVSNQYDGVNEVSKLLSSGQFYFSVGGGCDDNFSLLSRAQVRGHDQPHFCWNRSLYVYLQRFGINCSRWLLPLMCGSVQIQTVYAGDKQVKACLISRISCERAGTRFNIRGLNDEGNVANFVETEQVLYVDNSVSSFVQVRGLVPVFWDQPGIQTGTNKIRLSRGFSCSHSAFTKHFETLMAQYSGPTMCIDLLGHRDMEPLLSESFIEHLESLEMPGATEYINFDYHRHCKPGHNEALQSILLPKCRPFMDDCGHYVCTNGEVMRAQMGIMRFNCLDCLDRSNNSQTMFALTMLHSQLESLHISSKPSILVRFNELYQKFWKQNGDNISKLYAGTRALGGTSKVSKLRNSARSVQRTIVNNFMDSGKQEAMDLLLLNGYIGRIGQQTRALLAPSDMLAPLPYRREMIQHWEEFTTREKIRVCMATWNINGGKYVRSVALKNQSMGDWLLDAPKIAGKFDIAPGEYGTPTDIYAIGFQELVDLTASNMVATKVANRNEWGAELQRVISRDEKYSMVTSVQLVGVCLYVFVRPHLIPFIKDVGVSSSKTGIGGKAGNKGGVAIRLLLHSTSLCFVCSHFAAHQQKVAERNEDFTDIYRRVRFPLNQTIGDNDYVFWCGDLNYRIDLPLGPAKDAISKQDWIKLMRKDQLTREKRYGKIFQSFVEGELNFAPTYKYDQFSNDYDTSEKCRVPAWCDRILWKRKSFLPVGKQKDVRMYDYEATNTDDTSGKYGWHPNNASKIYENELTSGDPSLSWWHPGRLLHYGRAELKTSDHRPVVGLFEIDVFRIDEKKRDAVKGEILKEMGPVNSTVVVRPVGVAYNTLNTPTLVKTLTQYGHIVLVRVMEDVTLVTFLQPRSAVSALAFSGQQVDGIQVEVESNGERTLATNDGNVKLVTASDLMFDNFDDSHDDEMEEIIPPPEDEDDIVIQDENEDLRPHPSSDEDTPPDNEDTSFHIEDDDDVKSCDSLTFDDPPSTHIHPPSTHIHPSSTHTTSPPYPPPLYSDVIPVIPAVNSSSSLNELHPNPPRPKPARPPPISKSSSHLPSRPPPPTRTHHSSSITDNHHHTTLVNKPRSLTESALTTTPTRPPRPPTRPPPPYKPSKT